MGGGGGGVGLGSRSANATPFLGKLFQVHAFFH